MNAKTRILTGAMLASLFAAALQISVASGADTASSADDAAASGILNNAIASCNKSEDDRFAAQQAQFQKERQDNQRVLAEYQSQNDAMHKQYDDLRANYSLLEQTNDEQRKQNAELQQKYQETQQKFQDMQKNYDDMVKNYQAIQEKLKDSSLAHRLFGG